MYLEKHVRFWVLAVLVWLDGFALSLALRMPIPIALAMAVSVFGHGIKTHQVWPLIWGFSTARALGLIQCIMATVTMSIAEFIQFEILAYKRRWDFKVIRNSVEVTAEEALLQELGYQE